MSNRTLENKKDPQAFQLLDKAMKEFVELGAVSGVKCDKCGSLIEITKLGDEAWTARCNCGKFNDTLRGI